MKAAIELMWGILKSRAWQFPGHICVVFRACPSTLLTSEERAALLLVSESPKHIPVFLGI